MDIQKLNCPECPYSCYDAMLLVAHMQKEHDK